MLQLVQANISAISASGLQVCPARHNNVINTLEHNSKSDIRPLAKIPSVAPEMVNKMCTNEPTTDNSDGGDDATNH